MGLNCAFVVHFPLSIPSSPSVRYSLSYNGLENLVCIKYWEYMSGIVVFYSHPLNSFVREDVKIRNSNENSNAIFFLGGDDPYSLMNCLFPICIFYLWSLLREAAKKFFT